MALRLIKYSPMPPGQYPYQQPDPLGHYFPGDCDIQTQAIRVSAYRQGNKLARPSYEEALEDIDRYTCQRLGGHQRWCVDDEKPFDQAQPIATNRRRQKGCSTCGHTHS